MASILNVAKRLQTTASYMAALSRQAATVASFYRQADAAVSFIRRFAEDNKSLARQYSELNKYLARRGWYLSLHLPASAYPRLAKAARAGRHDDIEDCMQGIARKRIPNVAEQVEKRYPRRWALVKAAIEAHKQGQFALSVPVFLSQGDGMCNEILGAFLFTNHHGKVAERVRQILPRRPLADAMFSLLREKSSVQVSTSQRDKERRADNRYGPLNRHAVLHGVDVDYATESNSLRALLLVDYLVETARMLDKNHAGDGV